MVSKKGPDGLVSAKTPPKLIAQWHDHPEFGDRFQSWLSKAREEISLDLAQDTDHSSTANPSRSATSATGAESQGSQTGGGAEAAEGSTTYTANKKRRAAAIELTCIPMSEVPKPLCWTANIPTTGVGKKNPGVRIVITVGKRIFLMNPTDNEVCLPRTTHLAGYFKGTWQMAKVGEQEPEPRPGDVPFKLQDSESLVLLDGKALVTLSEVVAQKQAWSPLAMQICYYQSRNAQSQTMQSFSRWRQNITSCFGPKTSQLNAKAPRTLRAATKMRKSKFHTLLSPELLSSSIGKLRCPKLFGQ